MATTETRTGFRLPWVSEAHPAADASDDDPRDGTVAAEATGAGAEVATAGADDASRAAGPADVEPAAQDPEAPTAVSPSTGTAHPAAPAPPRRPSKFLADLARAMRAAAETERDEILERFRADAKTFVETMHERSAVEAAELRATADSDIGGIRDWSKAEIARIREETERRIAERRSLLDEEIEAHGALIEVRIEHINASVETFETEMARFFEELLAEEDPAYFAEMASELPEPPSLEAIASEDIEALRSQADAAAGSAPDASPGSGPEAEIAPTGEPETEPALPDAGDGATDQATSDAVAEPAATPEADEGLPAEAARSDDAAATEAAATMVDAGQTDDPTLGIEVETGSGEAEAHPKPVFDEDGLTLDPRVAALGLTPDFGAAEAEAAAALDTDLPDDGSSEEIPTFDEATIASRLAGLVPAVPGTGDVVETRVVVSGLVSVASIAGFKRGLGRLPGVQSVSVSSGPDGEFVFAATCAAGVDLAGAIATMQGFAARVTGASDGRLEVVAHDPDAA